MAKVVKCRTIEQEKLDYRITTEQLKDKMFCVSCNKKLSPIPLRMGGEPEYCNNSVEHTMMDGCTVITGYAPYGSIFDEEYIMALICDECVKNKDSVFIRIPLKDFDDPEERDEFYKEAYGNGEIIE